MSAAKVDVLPCPFCGATDIIVSYYDFRGDGAHQYPQDVVCPSCPAGFCGHDFKGQGTAAVISAWNRRVQNADVAELIDAADELLNERNFHLSESDREEKLRAVLVRIGCAV